MIYTFYSYKGGVGRSMALANAAELLSQQGVDVLAVDWDLEAPGLERFMSVDAEKVLGSPGVVDLLQDYKNCVSRPAPEPKPEGWPMPPLDDYLVEVYPRDLMQRRGRVLLLPAGRRLGAEFSRYSLLVRSFDWHDFYQQWEGELFFEQLRRQFLKRGDAVLIDSRTGVTEMGGVCTYQIADAVVMLCAANQQNLDGSVEMGLNFTRPEVRSLRPDRPLHVLVIPARVDDRAEIRELNEFKRLFVDRFREFLPSPWNEDPERYFKEFKIPHVPGYAFRELVASRETGDLRSDDMVAAFTSMTKEMARLAPSTSQIQSFLREDQQTTYDAFLSFASPSREPVRELAKKLRSEAGLMLFVFDEDIRPGEEFTGALKRGLEQSRTCVVFEGPEGSGASDQQILDWALSRAKENEFSIIPVLLPGAQADGLPPELRTRQCVDFRAGLENAEAFRQLVRGIRAFSRATDVTGKSEVNPYRSLNPFYEEHARLFFGREKEVRQIVELLRSNRLLSVVGPAGIGKTSLVFAGLVPALQTGQVRELADVPVAVFRPSSQPLESMMSAVLHVLNRDREDPKALALAVASGEMRLREVVKNGKDRGRSSPYVILIVDSFEEIFACNDRLQHHFVDQVLDATSDGSVVVIIVLRSDFVDRAMSYPGLLSPSTMILVGPLTRHQLADAIEKPAAALGVRFEPRLVERILDDLGDELTFLPILQFTLSELWAQRQDNLLTYEAYESIGSVKGLLGQRAEAAFSSLTEQQREVAKSLFLQLVQPGPGDRYLRRQVKMEELRWPPETIRPVVDVFSGAGVIATGQGEGTGDATIEIAHESILDGWNRLRQWASESRACLVWRQQVDVVLKRWEGSNHDPRALLHGVALDEAEKWLRDFPEMLNPHEIEFIRESVAYRKNAEAKESRSRSRRMWFLAAICVVLLFFVSLLLFLWKTSVRRYEGYQARTTLLQAQVSGQNQVQLSILLAVESIKRVPSDEAKEFLRKQLGTLLPPVGPTFNGDGTAVNSVAFSPDGLSLAAGGQNGAITLWDVANRRRRSLEQRKSPVNSVAFSPGGRYLAVGNRDGTVMLVDLQSADRLIRLLKGHNSSVTSVAFSPDGKLLSTASQDGTAKIWEVDGGREISTIVVREAVTSVAWSPDGKALATASMDGKAKIWVVPQGPMIGSMDAGGPGLTSLGWCPDGKLLALGGQDGVVEIWDPTIFKLIQKLTVGLDSIDDVAWSPSGKSLLIVGGNSGIRLLNTTNQSVALAALDSEVLSAAFQPDGAAFLTASSDGSMRLWKTGSISDTQLSRLSTEDLIAEACRRVTRNLTPQEWKQYFGTDSYQKTCPNLS